LKVPCPRDTAQVNAHCREGRAKYEPANGGIVWRIKKFRGDHDLLLRADVTRLHDTVLKEWKRPPITLNFQVSMFTASGLRIRFLKITEKNAYKPTKWIRYITRAGDYLHRI